MDAIRLLTKCALATCIAVFGSANAQAAVALLTVGGDASCDYRTDLSSSALQDAITAVPLSVPTGDLYVIHVARSGNYDGSQLFVTGREMLIEGGYETCDDFTRDTTNTIIDRMAAGTGPVMSIDGNTARKAVSLSHITLRGAASTGGSGLRIRNADVQLNHVTLSNNSGAIRGGGLDMEGNGFGASASLYGATAVVDNTTTQEGGGIYCGRGARLELYADSAVANNTAPVSGGGIYANACNGFINSGATGLLGLIVNVGQNQASIGAGLALDSTLGPTDMVIGEDIGASDPRPTFVLNDASTQGGGIYATGENTRLQIYSAAIVSNSAGSIGGGVLVRNGARVNIERQRRICDGQSDCIVIANNQSSFGGGIAVAGFNAGVTISGAMVRDNSATSGGSALLVTQESIVAVTDSFLIDNAGPSVVEVSPGSSIPPRAASVYLAASTLAGNTGLVAAVRLNDEGVATFNRMLVNADPAVPVMSKGAGSPDPTYFCNLFHSSAGINGEDALTAFNTNPGFINAGGSDYHLIANGNAVDRCPADAYLLPKDYDLDPRPIDAPLANLAGPYDVGADEWSPVFFRNGFED